MKLKFFPTAGSLPPLNQYAGRELQASVSRVINPALLHILVLDPNGAAHYTLHVPLVNGFVAPGAHAAGYCTLDTTTVGPISAPAVAVAKAEAQAPVDIFPSGLSFGLALGALESGSKVSRHGWNGKNMYLWYMPAGTVKAEWCKEPHLKQIAEANGGEVECLGAIRMRTADGKVLTGWLASQTDMMAKDWYIVS